MIEKISSLVFMILFITTLIFPFYLVWKTDRELTKQIEDVKKLLDEQENELNQLTQENE
jgi:cell division protein FtsB